MEFFLNTTNMIVSFWFLFTIVLLFLIIKAKLAFYKKILIIPLTFAALYYTIYETVSLLGYPYDGYPKSQFGYVTHRLQFTKESKTILMWVIEDGRDRLYRFPFTDDMQKELQRGEDQKKKGIQQQGKITRDPKNLFKDNKFPTLRLFDIKIHEIIPKERE